MLQAQGMEPWLENHRLHQRRGNSRTAWETKCSPHMLERKIIKALAYSCPMDGHQQ